MKLRSLVALALVGGLVAGSLTTAEAGKKKKKKAKVKWVSQTSTLFQRQDADACADSNFYLSKTDGEDLDCGYLDHLAWPALGYIPVSYPAADGVPFILDAKKPITGVVTMRSWNGAGVGLASVTVQLVGTTGGEEVPVGEWSAEYQAAPNGAYTFEYEIDADDALNKKKFTALTLNVVPGGTTAGVHGVVEHDTPPAHVNIPTLKKKVIRR